MRERGAYKFASRNRTFEEYLDPSVRSARRVRRIVESLRDQIVEGGHEAVRIRRILSDPFELYRLEIELPELGYQRTTLLDRDTLDALLEHDGVRRVVRSHALSG